MTLRALSTFALTFLSACGSEAPAPPPVETHATMEAPRPSAPSTPPGGPTVPVPSSTISATGLRWELIAIPPRLTMAERESFRLRRQVTNEGNGPVDARTSADYTLDGVASMALGMAFLNGGYASIWHTLPPGMTVHDERGMGMTLFAAPGDYTIAMTTDGVTVTTIVHVDP